MASLEYSKLVVQRNHHYGTLVPRHHTLRWQLCTLSTLSSSPLETGFFEQYGVSIFHRLQDNNSWNFSLPRNANILLLDSRATGYTGDSV